MPKFDLTDFTVANYFKGLVAGGVGCAATHVATVPFDVVKTRLQLDPLLQGKSVVQGFRQVVAAGGLSALATGLSATAAGYFLQGGIKFGAAKYFKVNMADALGQHGAWRHHVKIYLASAAIAELIADVVLCPFETVRIRAVSDTAFPRGAIAGLARVVRVEGAGALYAGLAPIILKQVPYTMVQFAAQAEVANAMYAAAHVEPATASAGLNLAISASAGGAAGVVAAVVSHPADTLLSKINKAGAGGDGSTGSRLLRIVRETGLWRLCTAGLAARCIMVGGISATQFFVFDGLMGAMGGRRFHFHDPDHPHHHHPH